jgi:hypothetical protein
VAKYVNESKRILASAQRNQNAISIFYHFEVSHGSANLTLDGEWDFNQLFLDFLWLIRNFLLAEFGHEVLNFFGGLNLVCRRLEMLFFFFFNLLKSVLVKVFPNILFVDHHLELAAIIVLWPEVG